MRLRLLQTRVAEQPVRLRLPFRFGSVTLRQAPQIFLAARVEAAHGASAWGLAAELLVPKWFDKDPLRDDGRNLDDLRTSVTLAGEAAASLPPATAFGLSLQVHRATAEAAGARGIVPLAAGYGPSLLDRAVLDAVGRIAAATFIDVVAANLPGFEPSRLAADMAGVDGAAFLRGRKPLSRVHARHTVGLSDPLWQARLDTGERVDDGLPQALDEVIARYGHRYFKLKIGGDPRADLARLVEVAEVLDQCIPGAYQVTLDGNEQYERAGDVVELLTAMARTRHLDRLSRAVLFVEQPLSRDRALASDVRAIARLRPVMIDESDSDCDAFARARDQGYQGVSSKQCKGLYKSMLNALRVERWNAGAGGARPYFLSAEDLSCQAGISVQQDLALASLLGIPHVERNGHHYAGGLPPGAPSEQVLAAHPGLYHRVGARACLDIVDGAVRLDSLAHMGYACAASVRDGTLRRLFPDLLESTA